MLATPRSMVVSVNLSRKHCADILTWKKLQKFSQKLQIPNIEEKISPVYHQLCPSQSEKLYTLKTCDCLPPNIKKSKRILLHVR